VTVTAVIARVLARRLRALQIHCRKASRIK
jgi:hypothetical protein